MQKREFKNHTNESCYLENFTKMTQKNFDNLAMFR